MSKLLVQYAKKSSRIHQTMVSQRRTRNRLLTLLKRHASTFSMKSVCGPGSRWGLNKMFGNWLTINQTMRKFWSHVQCATNQSAQEIKEFNRVVQDNLSRSNLQISNHNFLSKINKKLHIMRRMFYHLLSKLQDRLLYKLNKMKSLQED